MKTSADTWRLASAVARELVDASAIGVTERYAPGRYLYRQGERSGSLFLLRKGRVRIFMRLETGADFLMEIMGPPAILGEGPAFDGSPRFSSAAAQDAVEAVRFDSGSVIEHLRHRPALAAALLQAMSLKQRVLAQRLQELSLADPAQRVYEFLRRLCGVLGTKSGDRWELLLDISQDDVAAMTGLSRVSVSRAFKRLREDGLVSGGRRGLQVHASPGQSR